MDTERPALAEEALAEVRRLMDAEPELSRTALSRRVCERLGWRAPNGKL